MVARERGCDGRACRRRNLARRHAERACRRERPGSRPGGTAGVHRRAAAGRRAGPQRPGGGGPRDHRRAGRAQRHVAGHRHPVLPGARLRGLRRPAAGHRRRDRAGLADRPAGRWTSAGRSSRPTRSSGCWARSWPPTPGRCTTPPRCSTCVRSSGRPTRSRRPHACRPLRRRAAAPWSARRCSSACTASAWPRGPGPTCTTAWPARRCSKPGDVAIGISHSGQTRETIEMIAEAGSHGATTVALTSFPRSPLAEVADIVLLTATQATTFRPDALSGAAPAAGRARPALHRGRAAYPRAGARGLPG